MPSHRTTELIWLKFRTEIDYALEENTGNLLFQILIYPWFLPNILTDNYYQLGTAN